MTENRIIKLRHWDKVTEHMNTWEDLTQGAMSAFLPISEINNPEVITELYTGIDLKDGTELYEGDIVKFEFNMDEHGSDEHEIDQIVWHGSGFKLKAVGYNDYEDIESVKTMRCNIELVGNIHTHPELLVP